MKMLNSANKTLAILAFVGFAASACSSDDNSKPDPKQELKPPQIIADTYRTSDQMLLANEINESGEPFAESLGYDLEELDPMVPGSPDTAAYTLGIENYEYSRYQLGTVISRSGIGLHMMWAPMISKMAAMEGDDFDGSMTMAPNGVKEDDELMKNIMMFSSQAGHAPPGNPWPQFAEFATADPHLPQAIDAEKFVWEDFSTLRWDRSKMDMVLNPAALGQSMMKQYLWAQDMLSAFHDADDNGIDADGTISPDLPDSPDFDPDNNVFIGGDSLDGFIGLVLTAESINKIAFLTGALAYDGSALGAIDLMSYDPQNGIQYFPHSIKVTETQVQAGLPPKATSLAVTDASSHLFDQASILWGTASFVNMMDPSDTSDSAHLAYKAVFDGNPFPASMSETGMPGPYDLMKGTSKAIFMNLNAMHFDADRKVYVDVANFDGSSVSQEPKVSTIDSAYLIVSLERFVEEFAGTPLQAMAKQAVVNQADFIIDHLSDGQGGFFKQVDSGTSASGEGDLASQAAAIRGLYVAARITGDQKYSTAARAGYEKLISDYYDSTQHYFSTTLGEATAQYTPKNFAIVAGALREASMEGGIVEASGIYVDFFQRVAESMQLSEGAPTGETGGDSDKDGIPFIPEQPDGLPPVFASKAIFN